MAIPPTPPLPPPPPDTFWERLRDAKRSLARLNRPLYWLVTRGSLWLGVFVALYLFGGVLLGWARAYEVLIGITSPAATPAPLMGWILSLVGWLMVPAFVGGVTGYLVNRQVDRRRVDSEEDFERRIRHQLGLPPLEGDGR
ncbi:DUF6313 family protein [Streptomyces violaceusniger]|uniref:DUF6313 family protein n=1 Tax=Streptomyces violaceusniger TaxID=68280 RepID=UPI00341E5BB2